MSRNSKNAKRIQKAREVSLLHKNGEKGPSSTAPAHHKRWGYRSNPEVQKRITEAAKAAQEGQAKTSGKKILEKAGGASKEPGQT